MANPETVTVDQLREFARRLQVCVSELEHVASELENEGEKEIDLATGTFRTRLGQIEGFCRNTHRLSGATVSKIREDRAAYKSARSRKKKN